MDEEISYHAVRDQIYCAVRLALRFSPPLTVDQIRDEIDCAILSEMKKQNERKLEVLTEARRLRRLANGNPKQA